MWKNILDHTDDQQIEEYIKKYGFSATQDHKIKKVSIKQSREVNDGIFAY